MSRRSYLQRMTARVVNKGEGAVLTPPRLLFRPAALPPDRAIAPSTEALAEDHQAAGATDRGGAARSSPADLRGQSMNSGLRDPMTGGASQDNLAAEGKAQIAAPAPDGSAQAGSLQIGRLEPPVHTSKLGIPAHEIAPKDLSGAIALTKPSPDQSVATGQPVSQGRFQWTAETAHHGTTAQPVPGPSKLQAATPEGTTPAGPSAVLSSSSRAARRNSAEPPKGSGELETRSHDLISARAASPRKAIALHNSRLGTGMTGPPWHDAGPAVKEPAQRESIQLIPPPVVHQIGSNGRAANQIGETGAGVHIGSLEVHIVAPPAPAPPLPPQERPVPRVKPAAVRLARGFRSFGLAQG